MDSRAGKLDSVTPAANERNAILRDDEGRCRFGLLPCLLLQFSVALIRFQNAVPVHTMLQVAARPSLAS